LGSVTSESVRKARADGRVEAEQKIGKDKLVMRKDKPLLSGQSNFDRAVERTTKHGEGPEKCDRPRGEVSVSGRDRGEKGKRRPGLALQAFKESVSSSLSEVSMSNDHSSILQSRTHHSTILQSKSSSKPRSTTVPDTKPPMVTICDMEPPAIAVRGMEHPDITEEDKETSDIEAEDLEPPAMEIRQKFTESRSMSSESPVKLKSALKEPESPRKLSNSDIKLIKPKKTLEELAMADLEHLEKDGVDANLGNDGNEIHTEGNPEVLQIKNKDKLLSSGSSAGRSSSQGSCLKITKADNPKPYSPGYNIKKVGRFKETSPSSSGGEENLSKSIQDSLRLLSPSGEKSMDRHRLPSDSPLYRSPDRSLKPSPAVKTTNRSLVDRINQTSSSNFSQLNWTKASGMGARDRSGASFGSTSTYETSGELFMTGTRENQHSVAYHSGQEIRVETTKRFRLANPKCSFYNNDTQGQRKFDKIVNGGTSDDDSDIFSQEEKR